MTAEMPQPHSDGQRLLAGLRPWRERAERIGPAERDDRVARVQASMAGACVDALLIHAGASLRYFTRDSLGAPPSDWSRCSSRRAASPS